MIKIMMTYLYCQSADSAYFHNTIDTLRYLTSCPEVGMSQGVQKVRYAVQSSDKEIGEIFNPPSALSHRVTVIFFAQCAALWKANS